MRAFSLVLGITLAILYTAGCSLATTMRVASSATFSVDLIHRDSIKSPFYDHGMTYSQRLGRALQRSLDNTRYSKSDLPTYQAQIIPNRGEYMMNISFGNPPHQVMAIIDTASDLSWIHCRPCTHCKDTGSIFNPKLSSTYKGLGCKSVGCKTTPFVQTRCSPTKSCQFSVSYVDGTYGVGDVATETIKLGGQTLQDILFGCAMRSGGVFQETSDGVIGLGGGEFSLVSQLSSSVTPKFSYCLIPFPTDGHLSKLSSKLIFGDISLDSQTVSTPLVPLWPNTFYSVTLEGITVGDTRLNYSDSSNHTKQMDEGNMIVDSGGTLTKLPDGLYHKVEAAIRENLKNMTTTKDPLKVLSLCYHANKIVHMPKITMHFAGADVQLLENNVFVTVSENTICFAMVPTSGISVFGNVAQSNLLIGYDLVNKIVSLGKPIVQG